MNTTREEISEIRALALKLRALVGNQVSREEEQTLWQMQKQAIRSGSTGRDIFGFNPIVIAFQTALERRCRESNSCLLGNQSRCVRRGFP